MPPPTHDVPLLIKQLGLCIGTDNVPADIDTAAELTAHLQVLKMDHGWVAERIAAYLGNHRVHPRYRLAMARWLGELPRNAEAVFTLLAADARMVLLQLQVIEFTLHHTVPTADFGLDFGYLPQLVQSWYEFVAVRDAHTVPADWTNFVGTSRLMLTERYGAV